MYQYHEVFKMESTYLLVLLVVVVHIAIQDLDEEFDRNGSVHASIGNAKSTLQAFENALAVAIELREN